MASLIIKVSLEGTSREYIFSKPGPIIIGSDRSCDLCLKDSKIEGKLLEVRVNSGKITLKKISGSGDIFLDSVILPPKEETPYVEGKIVSLKHSNYQIYIYNAKNESADPPPFINEEFNQRLDVLEDKVAYKENELKEIEEQSYKKSQSIKELEEKYHRNLSKRNKLELEIDALQFKKDELAAEFKKKQTVAQSEETRVELLKDHLYKLDKESISLNETILRQNLALDKLKGELEARHAEIDQQKNLLSELQIEAKKCQDEIKAHARDKEIKEKETAKEKDRLQSILKEINHAHKEKQDIAQKIHSLLKQKEEHKNSIEQQVLQLKRLEISKSDVDNKRQDILVLIEQEERQLHKLKDNLKVLHAEEASLKAMNEDLRLELVKIEDKLSSRKNHYNQLDFQNQEATKKLAQISIETDKVERHLKSLVSEERSEELKLMSLRKDVQLKIDQLEHEQELMRKNFDQKKESYSSQTKELEEQVENLRHEVHGLESSLDVLNRKHQESVIELQHKEQLKGELQGLIANLAAEKERYVASCHILKEEEKFLVQEKSKMEKEISFLKIKLLDSEALIKEKENEAYLEIEALKRDERAKLHSERNILMAELEASKQKSIIEIDNNYRKRQEELHDTKQSLQKSSDKILGDAHKEADAILNRARLIEHEMSERAAERLKSATEEASRREEKAHSHLAEAQDYFRNKETEAEQMLMRSRAEAEDLILQAEADFQNDLERRKKKVKTYLSMKQQQGLASVQNLLDLNASRLKREEQKMMEELEVIKRKELKKIAQIRNVELTRQHDMKKEIFKELQEEKLKNQNYISSLRKQQEAELAETRKTVVEHINQSKQRETEDWKRELQQEKRQFEQSKKQRIQNAAQAVFDLLSKELQTAQDIHEDLQDKLKTSLELAINGKNVEFQRKAEKILEFNPKTKKEIMPVLKKWGVRFGIPAAVAILLLGDIGSLRTTIVNVSKDLIKQKNSASDIFVQNQKEEWKQKYTFNPETTVGFKDTFVDNVLYTTDFVTLVENEAYQNDWILKLHDFMVKELELSEDVAISYISSEGTLLKELVDTKKDINVQFKDQGIKKLQELEKTHMGWLTDKLSDPVKLQKFTTFRKNYFDNYYQEKFLKRNIASEAPVEEPSK